jgi:hypothetical protein
MNSLLSILLLAVAVAAAPHEHHKHDSPYGTKLGSLKNLQHGVGGDVYAVDERTLLIKNFMYDGQGPDAYFWVRLQLVPVHFLLVLVVIVETHV